MERTESPVLQLTDACIAKYLKNHPHFFEHYPEILIDLKITHYSGEAISLVQKQIELLRERSTRQQNTIQNVIEIASENSKLFDFTKRLVLRFMEISDLKTLLHELDDQVRHNFLVDAIRVLVPRTVDHVGLPMLVGHFKDLCNPLLHLQHEAFVPYCGNIKLEERQAFFPHSPSILSYVKIPLKLKFSSGAEPGLWVVGSRKPNHFHEGKDTLFLEFIGNMLERLLPSYFNQEGELHANPNAKA